MRAIYVNKAMDVTDFGHAKAQYLRAKRRTYITLAIGIPLVLILLFGAMAIISYEKGYDVGPIKQVAQGFIIAVTGMAILAIGVGEWYERQELKRIKRASELAQKIVQHPESISASARKTIVAKYNKNPLDTDSFEMLWQTTNENCRDPCQIVAAHMVHLQAYEVEDFYVAILPPGKQYYLKIAKDLRINKLPDRAELIQQGNALELHYVAGTSHDAVVQFKCCSETVELLRAQGVPFKQMVINAGALDEAVVMVLDKWGPRQTYKDYRKILQMLGGNYISGKGKIRLVLEYAIAPHFTAEADAGFVKNGENS